MNKVLLTALTILFAVLFPVLFPVHLLAQEVSLPQHLNFDGQLLDSSSNPITSAATVVFEIFDGNNTPYCLLYKEQQTITPNAFGEFSTKIGPDAGHIASTDDGEIVWPAIFSNNGAVRTHNTIFCNTGYTPASGHPRKLRVTVNGVALTPDYTIAPAPMATVAETLQGKKASDFLLAAPASNASVLTGNLRVNNNYGLQLTNTASTNFVTLRAPGGLTANYSLLLPLADGANGQVLTTNGTGALGWTTPSGGGGGESNTASNQGLGGVGVFRQKTAVDLEFRNINAASNKVTVALDAANSEIDINISEANLNSNAIPVTPVGNLAASNVNAAITELENEKLSAGAVTNTDIASMSVNKITSGTGLYFNYAPNGAACTVGQTMKWNSGGTQWECASVSEVPAPVSAGRLLKTDGTIPVWSNLISGANSSSSPALAFSGFTTNGIFANTDLLGFSTGGNERMRINGPNGFVGIGLTAPEAQLDVNGVIMARPNGTAGGDGGRIILREVAANGVDVVGLRSPDALSASYLLTLPPSPGSSGQVLQTDGAGMLSWVSINPPKSGICTISNLTYAAGVSVNQACAGVPASVDVAVHCSPSVDTTGYITARSTGTLYQISVVTSFGANIGMTCMWMAP